MLEGLARWVGGETLALVIWATAAAMLAALVWVAMILLRGGDLPLRSYRTPDGRRHTGALVWLAVFVAVLSWLPLGLLLYRAAVRVFWATAASVLAVVDLWPLWVALAAAYGAWRVVRLVWLTPDYLAARRRARDPRYVEAARMDAAAHDPMPHTPALPPTAYQPVPQPPENVPDDFYARPSQEASR